jgi:hypothetical protein
VLITVSIISALLFYVVAGTQIVNIGKAQIPYKSDLEPSIIVHVSSPENNRLYNTDALKLNFSVTVGENTDNSLISNVRYNTDWKEEKTTIFSFDGYFLRELMVQLASPIRILINPVSEFSTELNITRIPDGNHSIIIYASMWHYSSMERRMDVFEEYFDYDDLTMATIEKTVAFTIDTTPPVISILSTRDKYDTSDVFLNFTVNESVSQITYSLDGQDKVAIPENITLTKLGNGDHNVTVYATDLAGNTGIETMHFIVELPFPTTLVIASVVTVAVIGIVLLLYFKKRKH